MYSKLFSLPKLILPEQRIRKIIGRQLGEIETLIIIQTYWQRLYQDDSFNSEHFFLDLFGYLDFLYLEKNSFFAKGLLTRDEPLRVVKQKRLLDKYGYSPAIACGDHGSTKKAYLAKDKIVRFYYNDPVEFFYQKLMGTSEADLSRIINNNLLTVTAANIPGEPFDVLERALPLAKVYDFLYRSGYLEVIDEIDRIKESNSLITDLIEDAEDNVGLVVRLDSQGKKRVYVVAFDLELRYKRELPTEALARLKGSMPQSLDYEYLVEFIPELRDLVVQLDL